MLISIALEVPKTLQNIGIRFLDFINLNNRNYKKSLLDMDDIQFFEERDRILDLDKKQAERLFSVYEDIRIKREKIKKTYNV